MLIRLVILLSLAVPVSAQAPPTPQAVQTALQAARKVVQNAQAAVAATKEYQAMMDAQAALKAVEALIPVVQQSSAAKPTP